MTQDPSGPATSGGAGSGSAPIELVTIDNPRLVRRVSDGALARVTDQGEYVSMTTGQGYRDVTDDHEAASTGPTGSSAAADVDGPAAEPGTGLDAGTGGSAPGAVRTTGRGGKA